MSNERLGARRFGHETMQDQRHYQDVGPGSFGGQGVQFGRTEGERPGSGFGRSDGRRRTTMASSPSPGTSPMGKSAGGGILKRRAGQPDDDASYLKSIKEDGLGEMHYMDADGDSRAYSATQHGDDVNRMNQSVTKMSDSRLEESLRDAKRPPQRIEGLVAFLKEEHKGRLGIYTQEKAKLIGFWKRYVSHYYREERMEQLDRKRNTNGFSELYLDD